MKNNLGKSWVLRSIKALTLVMINVVGLLPVRPLLVPPANSPKSQFSADRALQDLLFTFFATPVIFIFTPLVVPSMTKLIDGVMASVLLVIYSTALLLPQLLFVVAKKVVPDTSDP